jgi:hypothetical protein
LDGLPLGHLGILEILYPESTVCVIILAAFLAIEQLIFVCAFVRLADEDAFLFITDAAILETIGLGFGQLDCAAAHLLYFNETN